MDTVPVPSLERRRAILEAQRLIRECLGHFVTIEQLMERAYPDEDWDKIYIVSIETLILGDRMWAVYNDEFFVHPSDKRQ